MKQASFFKPAEKAYGGTLLTKRKARRQGRPLATKHSMHLVLRSTQAKGAWSFRRHRQLIKAVLEKFAHKYGVNLISMANVGNHLHLHIQLTNRFTYAAFIRAVTGSIALKITGRNRWSKVGSKLKFWDRRPFTRIVIGRKAFLGLKDYIRINALEGYGYHRLEAEYLVRQPRISTA